MRVWWERWGQMVIGWTLSSRRLRGQMLITDGLTRAAAFYMALWWSFSASWNARWFG